MKPENVKCPECAGPMVSRLNSKTQQRFWGCKDFPRCRGTRDTSGMSKADRRDPSYYGDDESDPFHPGHPSNYGDQ